MTLAYRGPTRGTPQPVWFSGTMWRARSQRKDSALASPMWHGAPAATEQRRRGSRDRLLLSEQVFTSVVSRAEKRAERFAKPLSMVLVSIGGLFDGGTPDFLIHAFEALSSVIRQSDVMGWVESNAVLGIVFQDLGHASAETVQSRLRRAVDDKVGDLASTRVSFRISHASGDYTKAHGLIGRPRPEDRPGRRRYALFKRAKDVIGSITLLALLAPLFLVIAALVKLNSKGPILFRQERIGHRGMPFTMLKFRTMLANADPILHQQYVSGFIKSRGDAGATVEDAPFKIRHDPRVTRIGHVLRKTSCDELPQLWNVLRGDMSLVGPRPALEYEVEQYEPWQRRRIMDVKPGITGLWQVTGRSRTTFEQSVRLDLRYAKTCTLWGDIKILLATPAAVVSGKGAR